MNRQEVVMPRFPPEESKLIFVPRVERLQREGELVVRQ